MVSVDLESEDLGVLCESLWHSLQRADVPDEELERMAALRDQFNDHRVVIERIQDANDIVNIGNECFGLADGSVLCWRGQNYTPQKPTLRVRLHNWWVGLRNRYAG